MDLFLEIIKFIIYITIIVVISKYILVKLLYNFAESLNLKSKTVGNIAGVATSMPELLTVCFSSITGLMEAGVYNILSSNIINFIQYIISIFINKNVRVLHNTALNIDLIMSIITIVIPILIMKINMEMNITIVPIFILIFILFYKINANAHKLYLGKYEQEIETKIEEEEKWKKGKMRLIVKYIIYFLLIGIVLYIVGERISVTLGNLCNIFKIPQYVIGIVLGIATSIPELITFFESQKHYDKENEIIGVIEATNNLLTSNVLNLFIIQSIGIVILYVVY